MADSTINELQEYTKADANGGFVPFQKNNINGRLPISELVGGEENAEIVWDYSSSENRPSFAEVRNTLMEGKKVYIKGFGSVVGYCDANDKSKPTEECENVLKVYVLEQGYELENVGMLNETPKLYMIDFYPNDTSYHATSFKFQETHLIKYPYNGYEQVKMLVERNIIGSTEGDYSKCVCIFVADFDVIGSSNQKALPVVDFAKVVSGQKINGETFTEKAVILYVQDCSENNATKMYWWTESGQKGNKTLAPKRMNYEERNLVAEGAAGSYKITLSEEDENKVIDIGVMPNDCEYINFYNASGSSTPDVTRCTIIAKTPSTSSFSSFRATTGLTIVATQPTYGNARLVKVDVTYGIIEPVVIRSYW